METFHSKVPEFKTPEEEIAYLRGEILKREKILAASGEVAPKGDYQEKAIEKSIADYKAVPLEKVIAPEMRLHENEAGTIVLDLEPELHDKKIEELLAIMKEKGIKNTLAIVDRLKNPHLSDDFHRFLIQYLKSGLAVPGLKEKTPLAKSLHMTLYEVSLPSEKKEDTDKRAKNLKELISKMEQFYAGMLSVALEKKEKDKQYFTVEISNAYGSAETIFYVSVPDAKKTLFEKQLLAVFPGARMREKKDDYNVFNDQGISMGSYATLSKKALLPLKMYDAFDYDPLNVVLNAFSKIRREGQGAAIQMVFKPTGNDYAKKYKDSLVDLRKGTPIKKVLSRPETLGGELWDGVKELFKKDDPNKKDEQKVVDDTAVKLVEEKISAPIVEVNIRLLVSAEDKPATELILSEIESSFNQFENAQGNKIVWKRAEKKRLQKLMRAFSFRVFELDEILPLNIKEVTSLIHFPDAIEKISELKQAKAGTAPAPLDLPQKGTLLGINRDRNRETEVFTTPDDRLRHFYVIGQTGTGKTTLLKNMITQDILNGEGVCMIDPHGSDIQDILSIIPKERYEDVIYFDPAHTARPMSLNMLEYDPAYPEQKTFVVNELFSIFQKIYGKIPESMGPAFEQYFRNSALLVMEHPESGNTLVDISRVLSDKTYREFKLTHCKNPLVTQFWRNAEKTTGDQGLANYIPYVTNKFDVFLANDIMRPIVSQEKSSFNFREIMDKKKILLVNLSKGRLGDINSQLIGLIVVGKILMAALSRVDSVGTGNLPPFYLYIDEFQNVTTNSISTILSEARKYKLSLTIAHQFIKQLDEDIKNAVFGNVGSMVSFRIGVDDAEYLAKQFDPVFTAKDLMSLDNRNAYIKMLAEGKPVKPFNIETLAPRKGNKEIVEKLKELSYLSFGNDKTEVEALITKKYEFQKAQIKPPLSI